MMREVRGGAQIRGESVFREVKGIGCVEAAHCRMRDDVFYY